MRRTRLLLGALLFSLMLGAATAPSAGQAAGGKVTLQDIKYADLGKLIRSLKGKVVVVDFWAFY
jgi:hypothetical protein